MKIQILLCSALCLLAAASAFAGEAKRKLIYDNRETDVSTPPATIVANGGDLWVTLADLKRATGFVIKPQGVCRDELCFPIPRGRKAAFIAKQSTPLVNLSMRCAGIGSHLRSECNAALWSCVGRCLGVSLPPRTSAKTLSADNSPFSSGIERMPAPLLMTASDESR